MVTKESFEIFIFQNDEALFSDQTKDKLKDSGKSAMSHSGLWCGENWLLKPGKTEDGVLQRANKLTLLENEMQSLEEAKLSGQERVEMAQLSINNIRQEIQKHQSELLECEGAYQQSKNARSLLAMQQQQQQASNPLAMMLQSSGGMAVKETKSRTIVTAP